MNGLFNFVYETPCAGKVTGLMRLGHDGFVEILPGANLGGGRVVDKGDGRIEPGYPDIPEDEGWLPIIELGNYLYEDEMLTGVNAREGWSVVSSEPPELAEC